MCTISWNTVNNGSVSFTIIDGSTTTLKTVCVETVVKPKANFTIIGGLNNNPYRTCLNQTISFINLSTDNNGSPLTNYVWEIQNSITGEITTYNTFEPSHIFTEDGEYTVTLTVYNSCWCSSSFGEEIRVEAKGFDIQCPNVICENQKEIYSLPFNGMKLCKGNFKWTVDGGDIISEAGGNVEVLWNNVDEYGFGYVTFDPSDCDLECYAPTTIKIPVLLENGTIFGNDEICMGEQEIYALPQWPTTDFQWEIVGDPGNTTGQLIVTDQRNEIALQPNGSTTTIVLRCIYNNTLLNCGGVAEIRINVKKSVEIIGDEYSCRGTSSIFTNLGNIAGTWEVFNTAGNLIYSASDIQLDYTFNTVGNFLIKFKNTGYCDSFFNVSVVEKPNEPTIIEPETEYCADTPYLFEIDNPNPNYTYEWSITNGSFSNGNTGTQVLATFTNNTNPTVSVVAIANSPVACASEMANVSITLKEIDASIIGSSIVCASSQHEYQLVLPGTTTLFAEYDNLVWSIANAELGSVIEGQGTSEIIIDWNNPVAGNTTNLIAEVFYCNTSETIILPITVQGTPIITSLTATPNPVCSEATVTFTATLDSGTVLPAGFEAHWTSNNVTTVTNTLTFSDGFINTSIANTFKTVTLKIKNENCNTFSQIMAATVDVQPGPSASISYSGSPIENTFCTEADINVPMTVAMPSGCTVAWFKLGNPSPINVSPTTTTIVITENNGGFGYYYAVVTDPTTGCTTTTDQLRVKKCSKPLICDVTPNPIVQNNAYNDCGTLVLDYYIDTTNPKYVSHNWIIDGPDYLTAPATSTTISVPKPGIYQVVLEVTYICDTGETGSKIVLKNVLVPYLPDFTYGVTCNGNMFDVVFNDNTSYYAPVNSRNFQFAYSTNGTSYTSMPINATTTTLPAGSYYFKQTVWGNYNGIAQPACEKNIGPVTLAPFPVCDIETVPELNSINCHDEGVEFYVAPQLSNSYSIHWDFDDNGANNSSADPTRVFETYGSHAVVATITNEHGCSITKQVEVNIPNPCFFGNLASNPANATACAGSGVMLTYLGQNDNCTTSLTYKWYKAGEATPVATTTTPTYTATENGNYYVKVISQDNCEYRTPTQTVTILPPPAATITGNTTFCQGETAAFTLNTTAPAIQWYLNNSPLPAFANQKEVELTGLTPGNYQLQADVTQTACTNSTVFIFEVLPLPNVTIDYQIEKCKPYKVKLFVNGVLANYQVNWSNGATGNDIMVDFGGVYQAVVSNGSCALELDITVPKNPEEFLWIFPKGCYDNCKIKDNNNMVIGPLGYFNEWSWNHNGNPVSYGNNTVDPYFIVQDGSYTLSLFNSPCKVESEPLDFTSYDCGNCKFEMSTNIQVVPANLPYCAYDFTVTLYSNYPYSLNATLSDYYGNAIIQPAGITIEPGSNTFNFTVIPVNPFTGGSTTLWELQASYANVEEPQENFSCSNLFEVFIPDCSGAGGNNNIYQVRSATNAEFIATTTLYPNPANNEVSVQYNNLPKNSVLYLYDPFGRLLQQAALKETTGTTVLSLQSLNSGWYIAVIKHNNTFIAQYKLIKN